MGRRARYQALLTDWCRALLRHQIEDDLGPGLAGGILCPACARVHGRCADAVYPLLTLTRLTDDRTFLRAAVRLLDWSDSVILPNGAFLNEPTGSSWQGITVFGIIALGEALRHHGDLLEAGVRDRWRARLRRGADFLSGFLTIRTGNINYPCSGATALAIAGVVLDDARYRERARALLSECLDYFSPENGFLVGEGAPQDGFSPRGCRAVDLGYNVEESLPNLALCGLLLGDDTTLDRVTRSLRTHLEFQLPDGAWDNSWGTRSFKWTYWGSRTSDGCQTAFALLADRDPRFLPAADRNVALLEECTRAGLLYGGPHLIGRGDPPCIHHTFCHAKALAAALDSPLFRDDTDENAALPREMGAEPIRAFPEIATWLVAKGPWRATFTASDWVYHTPEGHPSGGALSLLWHAALGPLFAAGMTRYQEIEPANMQPWREVDPPICPTPRIDLVWGVDRRLYRSILDTTAQVSTESGPDGAITVRATGRLAAAPPQSASRVAHLRARAISTVRAMPFTFQCRFAADGTLEIRAQVNANRGRALSDHDAPLLILPLIAAGKDKVVREGDRRLRIVKPGGALLLESETPLTASDPERRLFSPVPGFEVYPVSLPLTPGRETVVHLRTE